MNRAANLNADLRNAYASAEDEYLDSLVGAYEDAIIGIAVDAKEKFALTAAADWQPPADGAIITTAEVVAVASRLNASLQPIWDQIVIDAAQAPLARIEIDWTVKHPLAANLLKQAGQRTGTRLGEAVQFTLRDTLAHAYDKGLDVRATSALIQQRISGAAPFQADMLARCLPGETPIDGAVVRAVTRRWYEGEMVVLRTESGREFTATPNHPMLTIFGWRPAGELGEGDDLVCGSPEQDPRARRNEDVAKPPPTIAEVFETATAVGVSERRMGSQPDFHGDGIEGDVDIAWPDRELAVGSFAPIAKHLSEDVFAPADLIAKSTFCAACGHLLPVEKRVCLCWRAGLDSALAQDAKYQTVANRHRLSKAMDADAGEELLRDEVTVDVLTVDRRLATSGEEVVSRIAQSPSSVTLALEPPQNRRLVDAKFAGDLARTATAKIKRDRIVSCRRIKWSGHVFNLHSPHGYFIANGAYTGNTDLNSLANGASHAAAQLSGVGFKTWLTAGDEKVRPEHADADGQTVPLNGTFTVGGEDAAYPADPQLSDANSANCRCTLTYSDSLTAAGLRSSDERGIIPSMATKEQRRRKYERRAAHGKSTKQPESRAVQSGLLYLPTEVVKPNYHVPDEFAAAPIVAAPRAIRYNGTAAVEGKIADDNGMTPRVLLPDSLAWPEMPLPFMAQTVTAEGHDGAEIAGKVDTLARKKAMGKKRNIYTEGELTNPFGINEIAPMIDDQTMRYVSADLGATEWAIVGRSDLAEVPVEDLSVEDLQAGSYALGLTSGKMKGLTLLPTQALEGATIALVASAAENGIAIGRLDDEEAAELTALLASAGQATDDGPYYRVVVPITDIALSEGEALVASPAPMNPPREWFETPEPPGKMPLTILKDGRVYGHLACWDSCHASFLPQCVPPPKSPSNYARFHTGCIDVEDGGEVTVGKLMFSPSDGGHADRRLTAAKASAYYDKTGMAAAFLRATDGQYGVWVAGSLNPSLTDEQRQEMRRELRLNPPSGDWRVYDGQYDLLCGLAVAVPGFGVIPSAEVSIVASADGVELRDAIIASSGRFDPDPHAVAAMEQLGLADEDAVAEREMRALAARASGLDALAHT